MHKSRVIYTNDRKAPRMKKSKYSSRIIGQDLWKQFIAQNEEYSKMTYQEFTKLWDDIAQTIRTETVTNPLGVKLGGYTGELKLQWLPNKFEATNHTLSTELGEKVNHLNISGKGKVARLKWERRWAVKFNKMLQYFAFEPTREINKLAKEYIDENPEKLRVARVTLGGNSIWRKIFNGK